MPGVSLELHDTAGGEVRREAIAKGIAAREAGAPWREAAAIADIPGTTLRRAWKKVKGEPDHAAMLAAQRKLTEQHLAAFIDVASAKMAQKLETDDISLKDLTISFGIVSDKLARWHGWEKGQGGAAGEAGDLLYKIFGEAADGKVRASLTVEPIEQAGSSGVASPVAPEGEGMMVAAVSDSESLVIEATAHEKDSDNP